MEVSLPISFLKKPIEWAIKKIFINSYRASDEYYWQHYELSNTWKNLGSEIEYKTYLATIFSNDNPLLSYIVLKTKNSTKYRKLTINFEAKGENVNHQESIVVYNLDSTPVRKSLSIIPPKSMQITKSKVIIPYNDIHIELVELINEQDVNLVGKRKIEDSFAPTYTEILNSAFVRRWDYFWNVDEINRQKRKIKDYFFMKLIFSAGSLCRPLSLFNPRTIIFKILTNKVALSITFWSRNLIWGKQIRESIRKEEEERRSGGERQ